jgi:hypothetical protein
MHTYDEHEQLAKRIENLEARLKVADQIIKDFKRIGEVPGILVPTIYCKIEDLIDEYDSLNNEAQSE